MKVGGVYRESVHCEGGYGKGCIVKVGGVYREGVHCKGGWSL